MITANACMHAWQAHYHSYIDVAVAVSGAVQQYCHHALRDPFYFFFRHRKKLPDPSQRQREMPVNFSDEIYQTGISE